MLRGPSELVNHDLERQFGYTEKELIGQSVDLVLPESLPSIHDALGSAFGDAPADHQVAAGRELVGRKDGSLFAAEVGLTPLRAADGLFVLASVLDIDERHRLEDAHRAALEEQLAFERFVAELSFQFINLPDDQVDEAIKTGLGRICQQLGIDRSTFYKIDEDGSLTDPVSWSAEGISPLNAQLPARSIFPWTSERILAGEVPAFSAIADIPAPTDRASYQAVETKSALTVPLSVNGRVVGALGFSTVRTERPWPAEVRHRLTVIGSVFGQVLARQQRDQAMQTAAREMQRLRDRLQVENVYLRREERERLGLTRIVGQSAAVRRVLDQIQQVAPTDSTVLLLGETGTGKELFATQIHELSARHERAMVRVNCAAIPATLIESELFGREKGAFTGALARQVGRFELADHSTIFLDEIGDLPPTCRSSCCACSRSGQSSGSAARGRFPSTRGSSRPRIAISSSGSPRAPSARTSTTGSTCSRFTCRRCASASRTFRCWCGGSSRSSRRRSASASIRSIARQLAALQHYAWPGNIRELRNVVERAMIVATGRRLTITPPHSSAASSKRSSRLVDVEKEHIRGVLESTGWRIRGAGGAADRLGLKPTTLETRMAKLGLTRPGHA